MLKFEYSFDDGAYINIKDANDFGSPNKQTEQNVYNVEFINQDTQNIEFKIDPVTYDKS